MKKTAILVLLVALVTALFVFPVNAEWDGDTSVAFTGEGTAEKPYVIATVENLKYFQEEVLCGENYAGKYFIQTADIDLGGKEWMPIGNSTMPFSGVYNGQGFKITGLSITKSSSFIGLFGYVCSTVGEEAGIANLSVSGRIELLDLKADAGIGSIAGWLYKDAEDGFKQIKISNVTSNVDFLIAGTEKQPRFGGLFGYAFNCDIADATYEGTIDYQGTGAARVGGIVGQTNRTTYTNCVNNGAITVSVGGTGAAHVGGIAGMNTFKNTIPTVYDHCVNKANVSATAAGSKVYCGGILGATYSTGNDLYVSIDSCLNTGNITAVADSTAAGIFAYAGGISAYSKYSNISIVNSVNAGEITSTGGEAERAGGIIGEFTANTDSVYLENCTTVGDLAGAIACTATSCTDKAASVNDSAARIETAIKVIDRKICDFPTEASNAPIIPEIPQGSDTTVPGGNTDTTPAPGDDTTPAPGDDTTPAPGGDTTTPAPGGDTTTPAPGGNDTTKPADKTDDKKEGGCKSAFVCGIALVAVFGSAIVLGKKH